MKLGKIVEPNYQSADTHEEKECCGSCISPEKTKRNHNHHGHCTDKEKHTYQCNEHNEHVEVQK